MADEPIREEQQDAKPEKERGPWMKRLIVLGAILLVIGAEVGISYILNKKVVVPKYFSGASEKSKKETPPQVVESDSASGTSNISGLNSNIFLLENIVINPRGTNGMRYVAMAIGIGASESSTLEALKGRELQIRDAMNSLLADKSLGEFVDLDRRAALKNEIKKTVNEKIKPKKVESVYFTEYVIQ